MFESIRGQLIDKTPLKAIVETGGIAYRLSIPLSGFSKLPPLQSPVFLFLSHVVREDAETLYAFASKEERDLFETLITLSGIGPKTALAIIGHMELSLFRQAILGSDVRLLSKIPGIGKKSAERLILEMRSKLQGKGEEALPISGAGGVVTDAMNALIHLGYNPQEAHKAIQKALQEKQGEQDLGKIISSALQNI